MGLIAECELLLVSAEGRTEAAPVLVYALDIVSRPPAEIQRLEWSFAHASEPGREDDLVPPGHFPAKDLDAHVRSTSSRAAASSDSRPSSSPSNLRRRSSARISPTRGDSPRPSAATSAPVIASRIPDSRSK